MRVLHHDEHSQPYWHPHKTEYDWGSYSRKLNPFTKLEGNMYRTTNIKATQLQQSTEALSAKSGWFGGIHVKSEIVIDVESASSAVRKDDAFERVGFIA
jgi:hypothetical protein